MGIIAAQIIDPADQDHLEEHPMLVIDYADVPGEMPTDVKPHLTKYGVDVYRRGPFVIFLDGEHDKQYMTVGEFNTLNILDEPLVEVRDSKNLGQPLYMSIKRARQVLRRWQSTPGQYQYMLSEPAAMRGDIVFNLERDLGIFTKCTYCDKRATDKAYPHWGRMCPVCPSHLAQINAMRAGQRIKS